MKILRATDDQLIIENRPIWLAIFITLFGLTFLAVGLSSIREEFGLGIAFTLAGLAITFGFNIAFIRRTQLILDRPRNLVELRRKSFTRYVSRTWDLHDLDHASVETSRSDNTDTHRAVLVFDGGMDEGRHPITVVYSSGRGAARAASAINEWLTLAPLDSTRTKA